MNCEIQLRFAPTIEVVNPVNPAETALKATIEGFNVSLIERRCRLFKRLCLLYGNAVLLSKIRCSNRDRSRHRLSRVNLRYRSKQEPLFV